MSERRKIVSEYPHGFPRDPKKLKDITRLREEFKLQWRDIGPLVGMTGQGACLLYNRWKSSVAKEEEKVS